MPQADFDKRRLTGIGGSDAAAALGISPWRTPYDLWLEKVGQAGEGRPPTEQMHWGNLLEPVIAEEYSRRTGRAIEPGGGMLRHPNHQFMIGHIDRWVRDGRRILEVKTARDGRGWGELGTSEIPDHYLAQVHHYLIVAGAEVADLAVLIGGSDFRIYEVERDPVIEETVIEDERAFWDLVKAREPPPLRTLDDAVRRWGRLAGEGRVVAGAAELAAIDTLRSVRRAQADLDAAENEAKFAILEALADRGDSLVNSAGTLLATWKLDNGRKGYTVEPREPAKRFLLK